VGKGGRQGRGTEGSESWGWAGRGTQGRVGTVSGPPDCSVHLPPVCRKFLAAHPAERGRLWEVEPPGAWGQRDNIWLKVQLQQSRLHPDCEWGGAVPCGLIASRVGSDESAGETISVAVAGTKERASTGWWHPGLLPPPFLKEPHLPDPLAQILALPQCSRIRFPGESGSPCSDWKDQGSLQEGALETPVAAGGVRHL